MNVRHVSRGGGRLRAVVVATALTLALAGCGSDGGTGVTNSPDTRTSASTEQTPAGSTDQAGSGTVLAQVKGEAGVELTITSAVRDSGGFITLNGRLKNTSGKLFLGDGRWRGDEEDVLKHGNSLAGATLVDAKGKKRYYVLRDTEGRCLCTTGLSTLKPNETLPVFMQFPAPPASVTEVGFELPTFPATTVAISG